MSKTKIDSKRINAVVKMSKAKMKPAEIAETLNISSGSVYRIVDVFKLLSQNEFNLAFEKYDYGYRHIIECVADSLGISIPSAPAADEAAECPENHTTPADMTNTYLISLLEELKRIRKNMDDLLSDLGVRRG